MSVFVKQRNISPHAAYDPITMFASQQRRKESFLQWLIVPSASYGRSSSIIFPVYFPLSSRACESVCPTCAGNTPPRQIGAAGLNYIWAGKEQPVCLLPIQLRGTWTETRHI